ncbi:MAG: dTDP-4-dehydrorhamnose reductase [Gemmataceae bacterium]|nr:dTDP-4-dehydrorhamnose reductase [Gemmataceae bacterium]
MTPTPNGADAANFGPIVIFGGSGQLGGELRRLLPHALAPSRCQADLTRPETVAAFLSSVRPAVVCNAAAYNAVDRAETEPELAYAVNAVGVRELALWCRRLDALLVHFSTNYIFGCDVERTIPYRETDPPGPLNVYGSSKLAGEEAVRTLCPRHLVVRTCGLFRSPPFRTAAPVNFGERLVAAARRGEPLRVVHDQICTPTLVADLAQATIALVAAGALGLWHYTSIGACSWYEFARAVLAEAGIPSRVEPITTETLAAPARRPRYSVLDCSAYDRLGLVPRRSWREALAWCWRGNRDVSSDRTS